jgi:predicted enzyme related to lactoylglutathione lyase
MTVLSQHAPGTFCWPEIATLDHAAAKKFYGGLFGWTPRDIPMGADGDYTIFQKNGKDAAALFTITKQMRSQGVPPHWGAYVAVVNVDESAKRAEQLGARIIVPAFDVMDTHGRMATIQDPTGATVNLWQAKDSIGAGILDETGALCWTELHTKDTARAADFYSHLFNWKIAEMSMGPMVYTVFKRADGTQAAGMMAMPADAQAPPNWLSFASGRQLRRHGRG